MLVFILILKDGNLKKIMTVYKYFILN